MRKAFAIGIVLILAFALVSCGTSKGRVYDKATQVFSKLSWWDDDKYTETDVFQKSIGDRGTKKVEVLRGFMLSH